MESGETKMRVDLLGEYDEDKVPVNLELPLSLNDRDGAIVSGNYRVVAIYAISHELNPRMQERRRAEFICRLANGEIRVDQGQVLRQTNEQWQDGRLVVTYEPVSDSVQQESAPAPAVVEEKHVNKTANLKEYMRKYQKKRRERLAVAGKK